jgi:xanthine dehydrogenase accessory factor
MEDLGIFRQAASALESGRNVALVTVIATSGSTPGNVGYKMLVLDEGRVTIGTIGGGLIEAELIEAAKSMLAEPANRILRFDLGTTVDDEKGICGGSIELLIETFDNRALALFKGLVTAIDNDEQGVLVSLMSPCRSPWKMLLKDSGQIGTVVGDEPAPELIAAIMEAASEGQRATKMTCGDMDAFVETVARSPMVIIFGAGHLSQYIARYAKSVHFRVAVCDDRREYANRQRFPDADEVIVEDFGCVLDSVRVDGDSYVVIVTRGHKCDQMVLEQVVKTDTRYIGMIGSRRKTLTILERLSQKGISANLLNKVYSPIGISIGAVTPEEIALSVVCELVKIRRLGHAADVGHMTISRSRGPREDG